MTNHQHQGGASAREQSVLAMLRGLVPQRPLTPSEALRIAELQANHLLRYFQIETPAVPEQIVSELPRVRVVREDGLPVSGAAYWNGRYWVITVNADEPYYVSAGTKNRRLLNAAFFKRLYIDDDETIRSELAPPFDLLLRQEPSASSTEQPVDWKTWEASFNDNDPGTAPEVAGLKEHHLVGNIGLEPMASAM